MKTSMKLSPPAPAPLVLAACTSSGATERNAAYGAAGRSQSPCGYLGKQCRATADAVAAPLSAPKCLAVLPAQQRLYRSEELATCPASRTRKEDERDAHGGRLPPRPPMTA